MRNILAYVAGPISKGCLEDNIQCACEAGMALFRAGFSVIVPHLSCYMGQVVLSDEDDAVLPEALPNGTTIEQWYAQSLVLVRRCDVVLRLPGESRGADMECQEAARWGIPVFHGIEDLILWEKSHAQ